MKTVILALALICLPALQQTPDNQLPPGHPSINPPLPPGHPPLNPALPDRSQPPPPAAAEDVGTPQQIVAAYYDSMSGPAGQPRDWDRFRSLFLPTARLVTLAAGPAGATPVVFETDQFVRLNRRYFEVSGYVEQPTDVRLDTFGDLAHAWSTYEGRRGDDAEPYAKGVTSFQLLRSGERWWITNVVWVRE